MPEASTTPDLVGLTRKMFEAANRRDVDAMFSFYASDAVFDMSDMGLGVYDGMDAIRAFVEDWWRSYAEYEASADEILPLGENVILTINTQIARLPGSGGFVRLHDAYVFRFEDSLIVRWTAYRDPDEARAAAERLAESRE
jgi:hypothetical protein